MSQQERVIERIRLGTIKPTAELQRAIKGAQQCKILFGEHLQDYLNSLNEAYLCGQGIVVNPKLIINDCFDGADEYWRTRLLKLGEKSWGGITTSLEFGSAQEQGKRKVISISIFSSRFEYFSLSLEASVEENDNKNNSVSTGKYMERGFFLNPNQAIVSDLDDLLLTFTSELLDEEIL